MAGEIKTCRTVSVLTAILFRASRLCARSHATTSATLQRGRSMLHFELLAAPEFTYGVRTDPPPTLAKAYSIAGGGALLYYYCGVSGPYQVT